LPRHSSRFSLWAVECGAHIDLIHLRSLTGCEPTAL
jgi:hypothetical protein